MEVVNSFGDNTEFERGNFGGGIPNKPINVYPNSLPHISFSLAIPQTTPDDKIALKQTPYIREPKNLGAIIATSVDGIFRTKQVSGKDCNMGIEVFDRRTGTIWEGRFGLDKNVLVLGEKGQPASLAECLASSSSCSLVFVAARQ